MFFFMFWFCLLGLIATITRHFTVLPFHSYENQAKNKTYGKKKQRTKKEKKSTASKLLLGSFYLYVHACELSHSYSNFLSTFLSNWFSVSTQF